MPDPFLASVDPRNPQRVQILRPPCVMTFCVPDPELAKRLVAVWNGYHQQKVQVQDLTDALREKDGELLVKERRLLLLESEVRRLKAQVKALQKDNPVEGAAA